MIADNIAEDATNLSTKQIDIVADFKDKISVKFNKSKQGICTRVAVLLNS